MPDPASPLAPPPPPAAPPQLGREPGDEPHPFGEDRKPLLKRIGGGIVAIGALLAKIGGSLKGVLLFLPKLKLLTTAGSMLVSVAAYSLIWGWTFALGFVLLLLVHELGHVIQLRREGVKASAPVFIPFMGALIWAKSLGNDAAAEARTGLAGPVLGSLGAAALLPIWHLTGNDFWRALAFTGFFLNLFNLVPIVPLDGGRAMAALSPWMWLVGLFILAGLAFAFPNPIILLILVLAIFSTYSRYKQLKTGGPEVQAYYAVSNRQRLLIGAVYALLIVGLAIGMHQTHLVRTFADA
ncbi:MAG TPA: site-2 protease family protein [Solirubrobacteraceae bacterium]